MQGINRSLGAALGAGIAYVIPPYQRHYEWAPARWQSLMRDIVQADTASQKDAPHWLGVLLLSQDAGVRYPGEETDDPNVELYTVIDGQQRLVTLILWLAALAHHAQESQEETHFSVEKLSPIRVQASDTRAFEVALRNQWRASSSFPLLDAPTGPLAAYTYFRWILWLGQDALLSDEPIPVPRLKPISEGTQIEAQWLAYLDSSAGAELRRSEKPDVRSLIDSTRKRLSVFFLIHDPRSDETQGVIFDTLNGNRTELEPLDHVRNSLFIRLPSETDARELYEHHWQQTETALRRARRRRMGPGRMFLYDYLIARGERKRQESLSAARGAAHFATATRHLRDGALKGFIRSDLLPAMAAWPLVVRKSDAVHYDGVLYSPPRRALQLMTSIQDLTENPANPIVLHYLAGYVRGTVTEHELDTALRLTEAFLARHLLACRPQSPLRSKVMDVMGDVDGSLDPEILAKALATHATIDDGEIEEAATKNPAYGRLRPRQLGALFRGLERALSGPGAMFFTLGRGTDSYTIEHIYPQKPENWKKDLKRWRADVRRLDKLAHSLGNLTVVVFAHNRKVGNSTFAQKKKYPLSVGNAPPLRLNDDWLRSERWTDREVFARTTRLVQLALKHWALA